MNSFSELSNKLLIIVITFLMLFTTACNTNNDTTKEEPILVKFGDQTISVNEFIRRSEYTIRPKYCNRDNNVHKKIVLNSLIAELLLAKEMENEKIGQQKEYENYIKGRKEQAMREWLQYQEGTKKVKVYDPEIKNIYKVAGRIYHVKYFDIPSDSLAKKIKYQLDNKIETFESLKLKIWKGKNNSEKEIKWHIKENKEILKALYTDGIFKGDVVGPIKIGKDDHILMKISGWKNQAPITEKEKKQLWDDIHDYIQREKSGAKYSEFILSTMKGKKLDFDKDIFDKMVNNLAPFYVKSTKEKKKLLSNTFFNKKNENIEIKNLKTEIKDIYNEPFFRIDGKIWTVKDFMEELNSHPLVFRNKVKQETNFPGQFRLAIADLIRDKYLTKIAYQRNYQNVYSVEEYVSMWRNAILAQMKQQEYLKQVIPNHSDSLKTYFVIKNYLNPLVDSLQNKYSSSIEINTEEFNKIKLSHIDAFTFEQNVPYPIMVPNFPQITTDYNLNYGKRMN